MRTWEIRKGQEVLATLTAPEAETGGLHGRNPFVWVLRDKTGLVIGTLYLGTNMTLVEQSAKDKSS